VQRRVFTACFRGFYGLPQPVFSKIVSSAFFLSHDIRRDVELNIVFFEEGVAARFIGSRLRHIHVDEASLRGVYRKLRLAVERGGGSPHWGVYVTPLRKLSRMHGYVPSTKGVEVREVRCGTTCLFTLGCPWGGVEVKVSVKPRPIDAYIALVNILLDRIEEGLPPLPP